MAEKKRGIWYLFVLEPYHWLQRCFFQHVRFKHDFGTLNLSQRLVMMLRLTPLLFFSSYTPALIIRIVIFILRPDLSPHYAIYTFFPLTQDIGCCCFDAPWQVALTCRT